MADRWFEWETPWRTFTHDGRPFRMKIEYGLDSVNMPPMFHFSDRVEEKLRNNRWNGRSIPPGGPDPAELFPELGFLKIWHWFQGSPVPQYLDNARFFLDGRNFRAFLEKIHFGALPDDDASLYEGKRWEDIRPILEARHPRLLEAFSADYARLPIQVEGSGQQETLRLLPPGVRRVIKEYAARIQAVAPGTILWDQILGCGHYGCVVPIEGTDQVLKVSTDATEGPVVAAILASGLDKELEGLIQWGSVWEISEYEGRGARARAYVIIRQAVKPLQRDDIDFGLRWVPELSKYNEAMRRVRTLKRPYMIEQAREQADEALQGLYSFNETYYVAEAIDTLRKANILLSDVHAMNLGAGPNSRTVTWADGEQGQALLIFDPGHSSAPPVEVPELP